MTSSSYCKRLMIFYLYAKNYKKRLNCSKDIVIWKIERSDWSRAFMNKSREWEFSQIWDLCRKLANHNTLHFKSFLAKTNNSTWCKSPNPPFLPIFRPFFHFFEKWEFSWKIRLSSLLCLYVTLTSCKISEKNNEPIMRKVHYRLTDWLTH